ARDAGVGPVVVQPVAPLVVKDRRDLAGVPAPAPGIAVEVDRGAVPESVAGLVEVHVGGELGAEPGVAGQVSARLLLDPVQLVEPRSGGMGVSDGVTGGDDAVGAGRGPEVDVAGAALVDGPAGVHHAHVLTGEGGADTARRAAREYAPRGGEAPGAEVG